MIRQRYAVIKTSFGELFITAQDDHIVRIGTTQPHTLTTMRQDDLPILKSSAAVLQEYLDGYTLSPTLPLALQAPPFTRRVIDSVCRIPYGQTVTSEKIAQRIGKPHAVRAVETVCRDNPFCIVIPSHRVLRSDERQIPSTVLTTDEALRRLEKRHLDKGDKRR